ncbi:hypothetical protein [Streptomyces catenulae]|uniref:Secreted protein n=1 Tax=Streptomyces catenulae TaxID=66875 RepID=A0ABV2YS90_9ACTN|nr:hypothetical protein [Streptomyces catenulae]
MRFRIKAAVTATAFLTAGFTVPATAVPVAAEPVPAATARPASASTIYCPNDADFAGTSIRIRSAPDLGSATRGYGNHHDCFTGGFQTTGARVNCGANSTDQWQYGTDRRTHVTGYVSWCYLEVDGTG